MSEHEITRLLQLTLRVPKKIGVDVNDPEYDQLEKDVAPVQVLERMNEAENGRREPEERGS